ncbi:hypothetical protein SCAPIOD20026 [Staphylococcus capitis]|nr:hypothetical protein SCAPIOD20015 [Staphylococcus capitis]CQD27689.1 hypothetical protein SCAPIOD20026 [Staphylococcus capitis]CQD30402.1 hypothetical protein SCAPIOD10136 [Staphylococcus capitis]CRN10288.1 hypothetical protein BN151710227 [Staphylococcus capitis]CUT93596.1 hypothetical protein BN1317_10138 [Staphylococcus capitis]
MFIIFQKQKDYKHLYKSIYSLYLFKNKTKIFILDKYYLH